jgi:hypothetical protein
MMVMLVVSNSEYQLGRRHADEIVAAGDKMMALARGAGEPITIHAPLTDGRVPAGLLLLQPVSIQFSASEVYIYTGGHSGKGFFIYQQPRPEPPVPSDCWQINSRLWWYAGA